MHNIFVGGVVVVALFIFAERTSSSTGSTFKDLEFIHNICQNTSVRTKKKQQVMTLFGTIHANVHAKGHTNCRLESLMLSVVACKHTSVITI